MHFLKLIAAFLVLLLVSSSVFCITPTPARAEATLSRVFSATAPTGSLGTIRQVRTDITSGETFVHGSATSTFGKLTSDGTTYSNINYDIVLPSTAASDFVVSGNKAFFVINGSTHAILRYDISDSTAHFVASSTLAAGTSAITLGGGDVAIYASKGTNLYSFDTNLASLASTMTLSYSAARLAYGGDQVFYLSTTGRVMRAGLGGADTTIATGGPTSAHIRGFSASSDGSALYYSTSSTLSKLLTTNGTVLWTKAFSNVADFDVNTSTGRITTITDTGTVTTYEPIDTLASVSATASGTSAILNWTTGVSDSDLSGVTIRRSTISYPENVTAGVAVTSSNTGVSFTDSDLSDGTTYYYTFFNETIDGYYSGAATSSVTIDLPPDAPALTTEATGNDIYLNWSVPADTASFVLRRDTSDFPATYTDGSVVTSTDNSVTSLIEAARPDGTYYYSLFAADAGGNYSTAGTSTVTVDTAAPDAPTLSVITSGANAYLSWNVPATTFSFLLRRSTSAFPVTIVQGTTVTSTVDTSFAQTGMSDGIYYYSLFARDSFGNYSTAGTSSAVIDTTGPSAPSSFTATVNGSSVGLSWSNPVDADFASSSIRRSTIDFPTSTTDGTAVTSTVATSYTDTSLTNGTYYYSIFSQDTTNNFSIHATTSAVVNTYVAPSPSPISAGGGGNSGSSIFSLISTIFQLGPSSLTSPSLVSSSPAPEIPSQHIQNLQVVTERIVRTPIKTALKPFVRILRPGDSGAEVKALQVFLNAHGFLVAKTGVGSPGRESNFFGPATAKAVNKFQEAHMETILKPYNLKRGTGVFGAKMMAVMNAMNVDKP